MYSSLICRKRSNCSGSPGCNVNSADHCAFFSSCLYRQHICCSRGKHAAVLLPCRPVTFRNMVGCSLVAGGSCSVIQADICLPCWMESTATTMRMESQFSPVFESQHVLKDCYMHMYWYNAAFPAMPPRHVGWHGILIYLLSALCSCCCCSACQLAVGLLIAGNSTVFYQRCRLTGWVK